MGVEGRKVKMISKPKRKSPRMKAFDYATPTAYFITICTHEKQCIFGKPDRLNQYGSIAHHAVLEIPSLFPCVSIEHFVIMPNHVHMLLTINAGTAELMDRTPNLSTIVGTYKSRAARLIHQINPGLNVWQRSYHDHVPRNEKSWQAIWKYIEENPYHWENDVMYMHQD